MIYIYLFLGILTTIYARRTTHDGNQSVGWFIVNTLFWPIYFLIYTEIDLFPKKKLSLEEMVEAKRRAFDEIGGSHAVTRGMKGLNEKKNK